MPRILGPPRPAVLLLSSLRNAKIPIGSSALAGSDTRDNPTRLVPVSKIVNCLLVESPKLDGPVVPIPTFPAESMTIRSEYAPPLIEDWKVRYPVGLAVP